MAHLLKNAEPSWYVRNRLADAFDPSSVYARNIVFGFRHEGKPEARIKHRQIAREMVRMVRGGTTVSEAVRTAVTKHRFAVTKHRFKDERPMRRIWARYGKPWLED